jgi:hypothetical protein
LEVDVMKKINVILHVPMEEGYVNEIVKISSDTYLSSLLHVLNKSDLTLEEKHEFLNKIFKHK